MTHTYKVTGITCSGCATKVESLLSVIKDVKKVSVNVEKGEAVIDMDAHISTAALKAALQPYPKYGINENKLPPKIEGAAFKKDEQKSWFEVYKPILLIFGYLLLITVFIQRSAGSFSWMQWMNHFMAGFFLTFSFFKLLNLEGFAESYSMYDIVAKKWKAWGYIYPFAELALELAFLVSFNPLATNIFTLLIMTVSIIGVLQSVLAKRKIKCACLGDVFNLPMSTITIIENGLMIGMSLIMLAPLI